MSEYPEHDKLQAISDESQTIGLFLDTSGYTLCRVMYRAPHNGIGALSETPTKDDQDGRLVPVSTPINDILADYFDIDQAKIEEEKRAMLDQLRAMNEWRD